MPCPHSAGVARWVGVIGCWPVLETADVGATRASEETLASKGTRVDDDGAENGDDADRGEPASSGRERQHDVPMAGQHVGRYIVLGEVGSGAMGVVFAAYDPELDRKIAIKLWRRRGRDATSAAARLMREAQALAKLNHPNVVAVYDVGEHAGSVFVAMEFVEGETLRAWLKRSRARGDRWENVLPTLIAAGRGLQAAHRQGLVHRDFKPDNVMVQPDGRVVVMDFGLARGGRSGKGPSSVDTPAAPRGLEAGAIEGPSPARTSSPIDATQDAAPSDDDATSRSPSNAARSSAAATVTRTGAILGTPAYMAPEQFLGLELTPKSDQFAFGVVLYEAVYGERPFDGETLAALSVAVCEGKLRPRPAGVIPRWLERALLRAMATETERRFSDMDALLDELGTGERRRTRGRVGLALGALGFIAAAILGAREVQAQSIRGECERRASDDAAIWSGDPSDVGGRDVDTAEAPHAQPDTRAERAAVLAKLDPWLSKHAAALADATRTACLGGELDASLDTQTYEKARWCLEDRRIQLRAFAARVADTDVRGLNELVDDAANLRDVTTCLDPRALTLLPEPPPRAEWERLGVLRTDLAKVEVVIAEGGYADALTLVQEAQAQAERLGWKPLLAQARYLHGSLLESVGRPAEGLEITRAAYELAAATEHWDLAAAAAMEAVKATGTGLGRHDEAELWAFHAKVAIAQSSDPLGLRESTRLMQLGQVKLERGDLPVARELAEDVLARNVEAVGATHPRVALSHSFLGRVLAAQGEYTPAREHYEQAIEILRVQLGPDHPYVAIVHQNLGLVLTWDQRLDDAEKVMLEAKRIYTKSAGPRSTSVQEILSNLGLAYLRGGRSDEGIAALEEAYAMSLDRQEGNAGERVFLMSSLANAYMGKGDVERASTWMKDALALAERSDIPAYPTRFSLLLTKGEVDLGRDALDDARASFESAIEIATAGVGPDHANVGAARSWLADVLRQQGDLAGAHRELQRSYEIYLAAMGDDHPDLAYSLHGLGEIAMERREWKDALAFLERAHALRTKHEVGPQERASSALTLAAALWDAPADAGRDRARAQEILNTYGDTLDPTLAAPEQLATLERLRGAAASSP